MLARSTTVPDARQSQLKRDRLAFLDILGRDFGVQGETPDGAFEIFRLVLRRKVFDIDGQRFGNDVLLDRAVALEKAEGIVEGISGAASVGYGNVNSYAHAGRAYRELAGFQGDYEFLKAQIVVDLAAVALAVLLIFADVLDVEAGELQFRLAGVGKVDVLIVERDGKEDLFA